jgi:hypothetical protein
MAPEVNFEVIICLLITGYHLFFVVVSLHTVKMCKQYFSFDSHLVIISEAPESQSHHKSSGYMYSCL